MSNLLGWDTWVILIPPEFTVPGAVTGDASQIVSTLGNSYANYIVTKLGAEDRYAPDWTMVAVTADGSADENAAGTTYYNHQFINFTSVGEWYYVRINDVTAPSTAGRYFFKMALYSGGDKYGVGPTLAGGNNNSGEQQFVWVPPQNWPLMLVKGETDPGIITGTLRYAGYNATLYRHPIAEAGMIWAHMKMRLDPYTGEQRPDLPTIDGQAFVNATANGHYELEGLAPGIYDIYAEAAGYPQSVCVSGVPVLKGQSLHLDCYLEPGPVIHGNAYSKHQFGDQPWPGDNVTEGQYIKIEVYSNPTLSNIANSSVGPPISWTPLPCTAGGQEDYVGRLAAGLCGDPRDGSEIAFPWHEYSTVNSADYNEVTNVFTGTNNGYIRDVAERVFEGTAATSYAPTTSPGSTQVALTSDPEGVGPPQSWFVHGGTVTPFHFEMGVKGEYGAPRDLSGEVPQVYATWINGLTPGRYYVRAWTFRYVQTALDGATFQAYYFDVTPNEWAGDVTLPIDLHLSSWVNKTVYFHDTPDTTFTTPIHSGAGYIWGNLIGADGHVYSHNVTGLGFNGSYYYNFPCSSYDQFSYGQVANNSNMFPTGESGAPGTYCVASNPSQEGSALDKEGLNSNATATGIATIQFWGINDTWGGENYGIPSGTYTPTVGVDGYFSVAPPEQVSLTLSGSPTSISDHLFLGPGFNVSVNSITWQLPFVSKNWTWSGCQGYFDSSCVGSEIDVGWYPIVNGTAGTLADYMGAEPTFLPPTVGPAAYYGGLFQGPFGIDCVNNYPPAYTCSQMDGGGRNVLPGYGLAHAAYYGQSAEYAFVGGYTPGLLGFLTAQHLLTDPMFTTPLLVWPLYFNQGEYNLAAYTYGYFQNEAFTAYAAPGQVADIQLYLVTGINVSLDILFKKEGITTPTSSNMSARVRLFNDQSGLVAEWMSSEGAYVDRSGHAIAANGALKDSSCAIPTDGVGSYCNPLYPFNNLITVATSGLNGYNYLPAGVTILHILLAGLPEQPPFGAEALTGMYYGDPVATGLPIAPALAPLSEGFGPYGPCDFQLDCYPAPYGFYPFPYAGIAGAPDYMGGWTAEVDFVPWYANNTETQELASGGGQTPTNSVGLTVYAQYYPPVNGLLMGESYHIIPGTTATSGISLTEDMAQNATFLDHSMVANHLGPYSQRGAWQIAGVYNGGDASAIFEVDLNGFVSGNVLGFTWSNEFRTVGWGTINVTAATGAIWNIYTYDGLYQVFLPSGQYKFTLTEPGYASQTWTVPVSAGEKGTGQNTYLEQNNMPVPEFTAASTTAFSALATSTFLLRRRRKRTK